MLAPDFADPAILVSQYKTYVISLCRVSSPLQLEGYAGCNNRCNSESAGCEVFGNVLRKKSVSPEGSYTSPWITCASRGLASLCSPIAADIGGSIRLIIIRYSGTLATLSLQVASVEHPPVRVT